jgi:hypothetical protein
MTGITAAMLGVVIYGAWLGYATLPNLYQSASPRPRAVQSSVVATVPRPVAIAKTTSTAPPAAPKSQPAAASKPDQEKRLTAPPKPSQRSAWIVISVLGLVVIGIARLSVDVGTEETDSDRFRQALKDWHPLLFVARTTPRAMKRCINRLRFYAMRQRTNPLPEGFFERVARWILREKESVAPQETSLRIDEDILVALGVIQHVYPAWLDVGDFWEHPQAFLRSKHLPDKLNAAVEGIGRVPIAALRDEFRRICAGVYVAGSNESEMAERLRFQPRSVS